MIDAEASVASQRHEDSEVIKEEANGTPAMESAVDTVSLYESDGDAPAVTTGEATEASEAQLRNGVGPRTENKFQSAISAWRSSLRIALQDRL